MAFSTTVAETAKIPIFQKYPKMAVFGPGAKMPKIGQKLKNAQNGKNGHFQEKAKNGPFFRIGPKWTFFDPTPKRANFCTCGVRVAGNALHGFSGPRNLRGVFCIFFGPFVYTEYQ